MNPPLDPFCLTAFRAIQKPCLFALLVCGALLSVGCNKSTDPLPAQTASENDALSTVPNEPVASPEELSDSKPEPPKELGIGDKSPGLEIATWVKGEPVDAPLRDAVHVVEFWATWCGPCRAGMPHISKLQSEYGDEVKFIGVTREDQATVERFLGSPSQQGKTWDEVIEYRLAIDDEGWTNLAYMKAAGQGGIPCAFVVGRDGVVEWIGHPASIDEPLKQIVDGDWDRDAAIAEYKLKQRMKVFSNQINALARSGDWDQALELLDQFQDDSGKTAQLLELRIRLLQAAGRDEGVSKARDELVEIAWENASMLNQLAWTTATRGSGADLELALKAARRASELRNDEDAPILDTVARCYFELGQVEDAIDWQKRAVEASGNQRQYIDTLERYQEAKSEPESETEKATPEINEPDEEANQAEAGKTDKDIEPAAASVEPSDTEPSDAEPSE